MERQLIEEHRDRIARFTSSYGRAKLIATEPVEKSLEALNRATYKLSQEGLGEVDINLQFTMLALIELQAAMRTELGIQVRS